MQRLKDNINEYLKINNMSISKFALKCNVPRSSISTYCRGVMPTVNNLIKICDYFDCSCDYILGLVEENNYKHIKKGVEFTMSIFYARYKNAKLGKSDYRVAKLMGINNGVIANWNAGKMPSVNHLISLAEVLGTSVDYLIGRSDNM